MLGLLVLGAVLSLALPGTPVQLSYVYSDSMEPTIAEGDGYVLVPAGSVSAGDIVTFRSDAREEFITHRVVAVVDDGYLTRGDGNAATDQAAGHPVVRDADVVGSVLTVGGTPVVVPRLAGIATVVAAYWPVGLLAVLLGDRLLDGSPRARDVSRVRDLTVPLAVAAVLSSAAVVAYGAPTYSLSLVAVESGTAGGQLVTVGERATRTIDITAGAPFTYQFVEGSGVTVLGVATTSDPPTATVAVPPQSDPGGYAATVATYHYPAVLPYGITYALHEVHPLAAALASLLALVAPLGAVHWLTTDGRTPFVWRSRARDRWWRSR